MRLNIFKLKYSLRKINVKLKSNEISKILSSDEEITSNKADIIHVLCQSMFNQPDIAVYVKKYFDYLLLLIVTEFIQIPEKGLNDYQRKSIALSILANKNHQINWFALDFFQSHQHAPFEKEIENRAKKQRVENNITDLDIVKMCYRLLKHNPDTYRRLWDWEPFVKTYHNKGCDLQKYLSNQIIAIIFKMNAKQIVELNKTIPKQVIVEADEIDQSIDDIVDVSEEELIDWKFSSIEVTCIEGISLPIYNKLIAEYHDENTCLVSVDSTCSNLRSLAMGISSGKAICVSGPVGSGKTSLIEFMAKKVGRISPKPLDLNDFIEKRNKFKLKSTKGNKRKIEKKLDDSHLDIPLNGFVRIQLGDQTDSKVLLGQYRCTDVPGEFIWQAGILTQAVMKGCWLLLEDIDSATQDVITVLINLLENNFLRVPEFKENLKISSGFQLFVTHRTQKSSTSSANSAYSLLDKYLYTINLIPLSRLELIDIICKNYPKLSTISARIVDVFLTFSSGGHEIDGNDKINTHQLSNVGRTVSTRDLLKLCNRSSTSFQVTSVECAYLVFQNCVDLFCSHLPASQFKTDLIISIGARLGIIESRCIHLSKDYKPLPRMTSDEFTIGRATLNRNFLPEESEKRIKLSENSEKPPLFSFTGVSANILERVTMCVQQQEPALLVGETGVGKTSSVQYLAYQTHHKLMVVNMNNQSDVADLIGGYKPVDLNFVVSPLRMEFEHLFARAFDVLKNEKFLGHITRCFHSQLYLDLMKLMLRVIPEVFKKKDVSKNDLDRWQKLQNSLEKLKKQLKSSVNVSFAFITGSLVNCIRNGDWILLDEINLASSETLECLSTILEPDGSVILLERGDNVPIKRHSNFRIFACMNPSTDVGKKDLPTGIRNRFTEFFVDELINENDLLILVGDYLKNTGIEKSRIHKIVQLYQELRSLSQLELNDGLGNRPVFSLRTLCRALTICAKNLCGSTERNIYESCCLSFLTQLDSQSHDIVLSKIQKYLISDVKKILSQQIPKPTGNQMNFEGYWIEVGAKEVQDCKEYILTESVQKNLKDLARIISIGKLPILLQGPTSAGKTSLIEYIAKRSGNHCLRINNHEHTDLQEYIGTYVADITGKLVFQEGVLVKAMRNGYWIILDELNLAPSDILEALNRVLDDNRELFIPETQVVVKAHPNFMLFATQNPPGLYGGRKTLSRAFKNRFIELHFSEIPKKELEIILEKRCLIPLKYAQKMVKTMTSLQVNRRTTTTKNNFTLRDLFRWGNRYTYADKKLLEDRNYDWNQHLVDEGYLVLSAKVRNQIEAEIIEETLKKNFAKKIDIKNLFSLHNETSMVTKGILESILTYGGDHKVVWTFQMRRMAVLISKSLQFNEPVLLVGPTGCGKTTVCQILAELWRKNLRILNCHLHTEGADFLGGLRPQRDSSEKDQLFVWTDGPLVLSLIEGSFFLADEISLAEDSVLERLNCVLEPERTLLLAEKGGGMDENILDNTKNSEFIVKATDGFQFLATMNPGGDFGKKELSPALRNRFTEIWCTAIYSDEDLIEIAVNIMNNFISKDLMEVRKIAEVVVMTINEIKKSVEKLNFSIRDVLAWVNYIVKNYLTNEMKLNLQEALYYGLHTIFLDALEMLPYENFNEILQIKKNIIIKMERYLKEIFDIKVDFNLMKLSENSTVDNDGHRFGISPFYLDITENASTANSFSFFAPTTKDNLFRVLSALTLNKAILLEGPPGVGKSTLIENIATTIGCNIVRINLCEHTDIIDLFGSDLPVESSFFESNKDIRLGSFQWRDGPLLAALKTPNTWILLDELNLAPQSVLEGLNAILDHRGEVYIPELNKTFKLNQHTRIFATQNPLRQGGGRKGLPQSFLNRFTKVYLRKLEETDLTHVISHNFKIFEENELLRDFKLTERMVEFSNLVQQGMNNHEFGYKGGPFEANLRDMLRWCELLTNSKTGYDIKQCKDIDEFSLKLFEKMKLVYCERMRSESDTKAVMRIFEKVFNLKVEHFEEKSKEISLYWNDDKIFFNDIQINRNVCETSGGAIILSNQLESLKNVAECVIVNKPIIICGPSDCGKTKIVNAFCAMIGKNLELDSIDDSVTGSFQQFDLNRALEEIWLKIDEKIFKELARNFQNKFELFQLWRSHEIHSNHIESEETEIEGFLKRLEIIIDIIVHLNDVELNETLNQLKIWRDFLINTSISTLNTGGHFEWVDSMIVKAIKHGNFISLEHINLVSSAILDRLNPILEPHGTLIISEKGVSNNSNAPEVVSKHENFRIFFTMDPKHGELSRAMRNRCIELSIPHENYSEDDLRKLIFSQGVTSINLIKAIISIHKDISSLSDYSSFGVSHITKMAFLVAQNKATGCSDKKSLLLSAMEVYIQSTNVDLLGFGLSYYRNKMKEKVEEFLINYNSNVQHFVNYENLIVDSTNLTTMKMIKLQAEPLIAISRCKNSEELKVTFDDLHTSLSGEFYHELCHHLLYLLYSMSSFDDVELRTTYLTKYGDNLKEKALNLYKIVKKFEKAKNSSLPWNSRFFPRLRPYESTVVSNTQRITMSLYLEITLNEIVTKKQSKLKEIDAISYSKLVMDKIIPDTINNELLTLLYPLLSLFKIFITNSLDTTKIDDSNSTKIFLSYLWFNRMLEITQQKLYNRSSVREELIDELSLHFNRMSKHCVRLFRNNCDDKFLRIFKDIESFIAKRHHSMQLFKKIYKKEFTSFLPLYDEYQIQQFKQIKSLKKLLSFDLNDYEKCKKYFELITSSIYKDFQTAFINSNDLKIYSKKFEEYLQGDDKTIDKFQIEIFPIMEYFFIKSLRSVKNVNINTSFALNIPTINIEGLSLIKSNELDNYSKEKILKALQNSTIINSELCRAIQSEEKFKEMNFTKIFINGPMSTSNFISCLLHSDGTIRKTGLGEVTEWKSSLKKMRNLLWGNSEMFDKKFNILQNEFESTRIKAEELINCLKITQQKCLDENSCDFSNSFWDLIKALESKLECKLNWENNFILSSLISSIELNLLSYFPLIDPVMKNRLKTEYLKDDINQLERILVCYKIMSSVLNYNDLGLQDRKLLQEEIENLHRKLSKHSRKVALRPEICVYNQMAKDINHFLLSFCHPKQLMNFIKYFEILTINKDESAMNELISKLDLWISNSDNFMNHTLRKYDVYYRDFIAPVEYSITSLKNGFLGIRSILQKRIWNENVLENVVRELIAFPCGDLSLINSPHLLNILKTFEEENDFIFMHVLKASIQHVINITSNFSSIDSLFKQFDEILNIINQMWQKQEETKKIKQAEEDSLYITRTKCQEDDDETIRQQEIFEIFPESTSNDFNEFTRNDSLEQIKDDEKLQKKANMDLITEEEYKIIGNFFINLMDDSLSLEKDYFTLFELKLKVFYKLFDKFSSCFGDNIDEDCFSDICLIIGISQENFDEILLRDQTTTKGYNFYKDPNIKEAIKCVDVMDKLQSRVCVELEQWPEHAVLNDIIIIINRIKGFASTSPLVRFNVGMQILRQKVFEWNQVAHKNNNFKDLEAEIAEIIQSYMQMELQCWRQSLDQTFDNAKNKAYRYWFFLYNLIHEFTIEGEVESLTKVLNQFMESSNFAEFKLRLKLLKAFRNYTQKLPQKAHEISFILDNIHSYFSQFSEKVQEHIDTVRVPIESNLKKLVKINSFNKDLSYFSTESNIKQVHRNLHKHLKEFNVEISKKVNDLFTYKDQSSELNTTNFMKKTNLLNIEAFIIPMENSQNKFALKSRKLVKKSLINIQYPSIIEFMEEKISIQLETCNHLRSQKVDESLSRGKQKSQAKSILNQKRKALTDFFKLMTSIGMNYKSGLLSLSLNAELINFQIPSCSINLLKIIEDDGKANLYFNKSIFKMKLLMNSLLTPRPDLDHSFLERIKGFAVDLFLLVQKQRSELAENCNKLIVLKDLTRDIEIAINCHSDNYFEKEEKKFKIIQEGFSDAIEVIEKFKLILKCAPEDEVGDELKVLVSSKKTLHQKSQDYKRIMEIINGISKRLKVNKGNSRFIANGDEIVKNFKLVINQLKLLLNILNNDYEIYGSSISDLCERLNENLMKINEIDKETVTVNNSIDEELDKISHTILIAIQNIYKQYHENNENQKNHEDHKDQLIKEEGNQLKELLHKKLTQDIKILSLDSVNSTLTKISNSIFNFCDEKSKNQIKAFHPLLKQFMNLSDFFLIQQFNAHRMSSKMLSIMLSVFLELSKNGFCVPENLLSDEEQKQELDQKESQGFGFEDGQGEKDVSDKLESEDQLDEARKPEDYNKNKEEEENKDLKEEKGIDMSDNFDGKMYDVSNEDDEENDDNKSDDEKEEMDKEMGETADDADKLDDQIWGSDDEKSDEEESDKKDETGKGSGDKDDKHNDLDTKGNEMGEEEEQGEGLDAADTPEKEEKRKKSKTDIDKMNENNEEEEIDQTNPYHNDLEDPPEPEDLNLDENVNLDEEEKEEKEGNNEENPFDIDKMKNGMEVDNEEKEESINSDNESRKEEEPLSEDGEEEVEETLDTDNVDDDNNDNNENEEEESVNKPDALNPDEETTQQEENKQNSNDYHESKDKQSKEQNIQSMPSENDKGSHDQVQCEKQEDFNQNQEMDIDDQDTGEDKDGVGQAENKESKSGHQGVANQKEAPSQRNHNKNEKQQKRKKGNTDQERTLGDVDRLAKKFLKTVDKINRESEEKDENEDGDADEYQHVKEAKKSDKTTLDNATMEQSKQVQHKEDNDEENKENEESTDLLNDQEKDVDEDIEMLDKKDLKSEKFNEKSGEKPSTKENKMENCEDEREQIEVEGEEVETSNVPRGDETTAHCQMDIAQDTTPCEEESNAEALEIRKLVDSEIATHHVFNAEISDMEKWQEISNRMMSNARELCEQLRLILEPTKCTRLKGDYRTGRRINMKKIIPYIASQFRKDKIWLRRTKAAQRDYKITIAVDDSKSMDHNNSKELTLQAISLVSQALTLLESGKLSVISFGETPKVLLKYNDQFNGPNLFKSLDFNQNKTKIAELLDFSRVMNQNSSSDGGAFEHLLIILSDGRNIFSEGEKKVKNAIKRARLERMFIIYIIIDNPTNKDSILDIRTVLPFTAKDKTPTIVSYMDQFPFPYYVIVRDLNQLPSVLSDGLRQWFEIVNNE